MTATTDYLADQDTFDMAYFVLLVGDEIRNMLKGELGSLFHLLGFVNGILYNHCVLEKFTLPTELYSRLEDRLYDFVSSLCENVGLNGLIYFVKTALEDDEEEDQEGIAKFRVDVARSLSLRTMTQDEEELQLELEAMLRKGQVFVYPWLAWR